LGNLRGKQVSLMYKYLLLLILVGCSNKPFKIGDCVHPKWDKTTQEAKLHIYDMNSEYYAVMSIRPNPNDKSNVLIRINNVKKKDLERDFKLIKCKE
jgi:hypothetical protein